MREREKSRIGSMCHDWNLLAKFSTQQFLCAFSDRNSAPTDIDGINYDGISDNAMSRAAAAPLLATTRETYFGVFVFFFSKFDCVFSFVCFIFCCGE